MAAPTEATSTHPAATIVVCEPLMYPPASSADPAERRPRAQNRLMFLAPPAIAQTMVRSDSITNHMPRPATWFGAPAGIASAFEPITHGRATDKGSRRRPGARLDVRG